MEPLVSIAGEGFLSCGVGTSSFVLGMKGGAVNLFSYVSSVAIAGWEGSSPIKAAEFTPSETAIVTGDSTGSLRVVNILDHAEIWCCAEAHGASLEVARCIDSNLLVSGDSNGNLALWDLRQSEVVRRWRGEDYVADVAIVDGQSFLVAYGNGVCCRYSPGSPKRVGYFVQEDDDFVGLAIDRYAQCVLLGSSTPKVYVLRLADLEFQGDMKSLGSKEGIATVRPVVNSAGRFVAVHIDGIATIGRVQPNASLHAFRVLGKGSLVIGAEANFGKLIAFSFGQAAVFDLSGIATQEFGKRKGGVKLRVTERHDPFFDGFA